MIYVSPEDIGKILKLVKDDRLVIGNATYSESKKSKKFNMLGFLAKIVNNLQKFTRKKRDDLKNYWGHSFVMIKELNNIWVFEMDKDRGGKINHLFQSNTFRKEIQDGLIHLYTLPVKFKQEIRNELLRKNVDRKYNLRRALKNATFIPKWIYIFFTKKPKNADMCSQNIIDRWLPVVKSDFKWNYSRKMPEDLEYYLKKDLKLKPTTLKIVNEEIKWNT